MRKIQVIRMGLREIDVSSCAKMLNRSIGWNVAIIVIYQVQLGKPTLKEKVSLSAGLSLGEAKGEG